MSIRIRARFVSCIAVFRRCRSFFLPRDEAKRRLWVTALNLSIDDVLLDTFGICFSSTVSRYFCLYTFIKTTISGQFRQICRSGCTVATISPLLCGKRSVPANRFIFGALLKRESSPSCRAPPWGLVTVAWLNFISPNIEIPGSAFKI